MIKITRTLKQLDMIQKGGQCGRHHGLMQLKDSLNRSGSAVPDRRSFLQLCSFIFRDGP